MAALVKIIKFSKWFRPTDPLAAKIARLCILREDLLIEMQGVYVEKIKELDEHSEQWRRMYFLRRATLTLSELSGAIQTLLVNPEFKKLLAKQPADIQLEFANAGRLIGKAQRVTKDVRNAICGHVKEDAVQKSLERMPPDEFGLLDLGKKANLTHYKFAGELTAEILLKDVTAAERRTVSSSKFSTMAELFEIFNLIQYCLLMYAEDRGLI